MRSYIENISALQKQINELQLENELLKRILDDSGISYNERIHKMREDDNCEEYEENQGKRIVHPSCISDKMANLFYARFWGRMDVYAKRYEKKDTKEAGYYPQCYNFWKDVCPKKYGHKIKCKDCLHQAYKQLTKNDILNHLLGKSYNGSDVIGIYPLLKDNQCRFLVFDFDNHEKDAEKYDFANTDDMWKEEVNAMRSICILNGIDPLVERSRSGKGAHIWIFFDKPIPASLARKFGSALLEKGAEQVNLKSFKYYDRMLPAQDELEDNGLGNLIALPLQGQALHKGNSAFIDSNWNAYPNQWEVLWKKPKLSKEFIEAKVTEWTGYVMGDISIEEHRDEPWKQQSFRKDEVYGEMHLILSNGIYVDSLNLKPSIQNKIRRLAAFYNPIYYKNKAIKVSNFAISKWIYLGKDHLSGYIEIPRGLYDILIKKLEEAGIKYTLEDERQKGRFINVSFKGKLRKEQESALSKLQKYDNGILHAATAFGKTVVCSALISEKKVNTLILVQSSTLLTQWETSLETFLDIQEDMPQYETKSGRIKKRKKLIGKLQGSQDSMNGIVDIAMAGSLCKKDNWHPMLEKYGMIIVDECHHAASDTIANVLKEVKAKYVYGVSATPKRSDGLEKINTMLLGEIRYSYTSKEKALTQGIEHLVYPRFTRAVCPRGDANTLHPNEAYDLIRYNDVRDEQILSDVKECLEAGRTPVVLTKYKDHAEKLYKRIKEYADNVFLLTGNNSKKEHKQIIERMNKVDADSSLVLVATGSLIGEGFDFPRLDTLVMATPISFRSVVEQYVGRLNRDYEGKNNVIVYDYIDSHIPIFDKMYAKRLRAYKQIGYAVCTGLFVNDKQDVNAIYDGDTYYEVFKKDLLEANKKIVISSPAISTSKVYEFIDFLKEKQSLGVEVTVVTWESDLYGYGDSALWMKLHEDMRRAGFYLKLVKETC